MEFEILDEPQGEEQHSSTNADGGMIEDEVALNNQSMVQPDDYPLSDRAAASLIGQADEGK